MDEAARIGIVLEGCVQAQKSFANGSQVNVTSRFPGQMLGPAAAFSENRVYPCDVIALQPSTIMMFQREDMLRTSHRRSPHPPICCSSGSSCSPIMESRSGLPSGCSRRAGSPDISPSRFQNP